MSKWTKYNENLVRKWSSMSKTYSTMHSISAEYYNKWEKRLGIPVVLLGAISASSIFTTSTENSDIWMYINGGLVLLMTGISGVNKFIGTHEKQIKHTSASFKYTQISMNIDTLLSFPRSDREEIPKDFIKETKLAILEVREHSPYLPTWVVNHYLKKLDKSLTNTHTKIDRTDGEQNINWNAPRTESTITPSPPNKNEEDILNDKNSMETVDRTSVVPTKVKHTVTYHNTPYRYQIADSNNSSSHRSKTPTRDEKN